MTTNTDLMNWEQAVLQAIEELSKGNKEYCLAYLALVLRAGQLTMDTTSREDAIKRAKKDGYRLAINELRRTSQLAASDWLESRNEYY